MCVVRNITDDRGGINILSGVAPTAQNCLFVCFLPGFCTYGACDRPEQRCVHTVIYRKEIKSAANQHIGFLVTTYRFLLARGM